MTNYNKNPQRVQHSSGTINPPRKRKKPRPFNFELVIIFGSISAVTRIQRNQK